MVARPSETPATPTPSAQGPRALTDPVVPAVLLGAVAFGGMVAGPWLVWAGLGGVAGYSLSGSV